MMFGRSLAGHVHLEVLHVHCNIHGGIVLLWDVLCFVLALVSVLVSCVRVHDWRRLVI